jgi:hypothetical protein
MWLTILLALIPLFINIVNWLMNNVKTITTLTSWQRKVLASLYNTGDKLRSHSIKVGLPFVSKEVQEATTPPSPIGEGW